MIFSAWGWITCWGSEQVSMNYEVKSCLVATSHDDVKVELTASILSKQLGKPNIQSLISNILLNEYMEVGMKSF